MSLSYPVALPDPVTEPPVAEGDAAGGEEEEEDVHDEGQRPSGSLDVSSVHGPGHGPAPLFLRLHELICEGHIRQQKERRTTKSDSFNQRVPKQVTWWLAYDQPRSKKTGGVPEVLILSITVLGCLYG